FGLGGEIRIVTVEPVDALVRLEIRLVQDAPNGRAMHRLGGRLVDQFVGQFIQAPAGGRTIMIGGVFRGDGDDGQSVLRGKKSGGDRTEERLAGLAGRVWQSARATD